ncbi:AAA family ATPase [Burkholderia ubonensis]|uniref:AAA family ATPase n=1 Tax=Burkholderia ubonensis TaxID=101571 RepID=UPI0009B43BD3|nr:AAA family ATPase [Burkholderia ubonensis]
MKIYTSYEKKRPDSQYIVLDGDSWDDYGIKSTFYLTVIINNEQIRIGEVKIIDKNKSSGKTIIKDGSTTLPQSYCSLGQSIEYYDKIHILGRDIERDILKTLRDCTYDADIYDNFKDESQFRSSLIRFGPAEQALKYGSELRIKFVGPTPNSSHSFEFKTKIPGFRSSHKLSFEFYDQSTSKIPSNINILIGRNGTGKTQILSDLAKAISGYGYTDQDELINARTRKFPKDRPSFSNTIVVSYSAFDMFEIPGRTKSEKKTLTRQGNIFGYKYCGLRERTRNGGYRIKSSDEVANEFQSAVESIEERDEDSIWSSCLDHILSDPSFASIDSENLAQNFSKLSSGQKIVLSILANIFGHIEPASIVIVDEPETHLHPSLMAAFMHSLREILTHYDSYAIIATHSPVILQETPSKFVQVLGGTRGQPSVKSLNIESFGEEISTLTEEVFGLSFEESNFYSVLQNLSDEGMSLDDVNGLFGKRLGLTARSFISDSSL